MPKITEEHRKLLKKPIGRVYKDFRKIPFKFPLFVVGDRVTYNCIKNKIPFDIAIFDLKEKRNKLDKEMKKFILNYFKEYKVIKNPPGNFPLNLPDSKAILVEGEDDLLVLTLLLNKNKGYIIYGQPNEGVVFFEINKKSKELAKSIVSSSKVEK